MEHGISEQDINNGIISGQKLLRALEKSNIKYDLYDTGFKDPAIPKFLKKLLLD